MRIVYLTEAGASGTRLGAFLEALMRPFKPEPFMMQIGRLHYNFALYHKNGWNEHLRGELIRHFQELHKAEVEYGLRVAASYNDEIIEFLKSFDGIDEKPLDEAIRIPRRVLYQEMMQFCYFEIPPDRVQYWENTQPFGVEVDKRFPDAAYDVEQAAKCLALDRATASVFHLMRVMDYALTALVKHLKVKYDHRDSWDRILKPIKDKIDSMPTKTPARQKTKDDYHRVYGYLMAVKNAWRNPTMHPRKHYDTTEAEDIFCAMRGFMRDLSKVI